MVEIEAEFPSGNIQAEPENRVSGERTRKIQSLITPALPEKNETVNVIFQSDEESNRGLTEYFGESQAPLRYFTSNVHQIGHSYHLKVCQ